MSKQTRITLSLLIFTALLSGIAILSLASCSSDADTNNSKLDFNIKRLIEAEERGEAEEAFCRRGHGYHRV